MNNFNGIKLNDQVRLGDVGGEVVEIQNEFMVVDFGDGSKVSCRPEDVLLLRLGDEYILRENDLGIRVRLHAFEGDDCAYVKPVRIGRVPEMLVRLSNLDGLS